MKFTSSSALLDKWNQLCQNQYDSKSLGVLTVGLELEFFLCTRNGTPVNLEESQIFMMGLRDHFINNHENVSTEEEILGGQACISKVKFPVSKQSWTYVCYEYPPHLLEVSFSYHKSLITLAAEVEMVLSTLVTVAEKNDLTALFIPILSKDQFSKVSLIENSLQGLLRQSRFQMLASSPFSDEAHLADFPSYLAATHIHIGGHEWWKAPSFVNDLYRLEPYLMLEAEGIDYNERWQHYLKVFHEFPLVGFPEVSRWDFEWWIEQLYATSYQRQKASINSIHSLNKLRDLQLIRPRAIGTIEFRGDSAQPTVESIMRLATLRLGQYLLAQTPLPSFIPSYSTAREIWTTQMSKGKYIEDVTRQMVLHLIYLEIERRGLGEERYILDTAKKTDISA